MPLNRRDFLKITALTGAALGLSASAANQLIKSGDLHKVAETHYLMGTIVNFVLLAETSKQAQAAIQTTVNKMQRLIRVFDYRQSDSPLGQLNTVGITRQPCPELVDIIKQAIRFGEISNGAFDITIKPMLDELKANQPVDLAVRELVDYSRINIGKDEISFALPGMALTLDGLAKGSVVDAGVAILQDIGFEDILVEAGGDMMAKNTQMVKPWKIGITHPRVQGQFIAEISITNQAVATSGDYLNYFSSDYSSHHILDPRSGLSPSELASATVIAPSVLEADALSTTLMVLGAKAGLALIESLPATAALLVSKDMQIFRSNEFPAG